MQSYELERRDGAHLMTNIPESHPTSSEDSLGGRKGISKLSRRQIAGAGLAAPVIATLASRRALAEVVPFNCTVSGWLQLQTSVTPSAISRDVSNRCAGHSPGYWKTQKSHWSGLPSYNGIPLNYGEEGPGNKRGKGGTPFESIFHSPANDEDGEPLSLVQVMWRYPSLPSFHFIAGFLNAVKFGEAMYGINADDVILWYLGGYSVNGVLLTQEQGREFFDQY